MVYTATNDDHSLGPSSEQALVAGARVVRPRNPRLRTIFAFLVMALMGAFGLWRLQRSALSVDAGLMRENLTMIGAALALFALATLLLSGVWIVLLESVSGRRRRRSELVIAFSYAWLARYIPGTLPYLAGKVYLGRRLGFATRPLVMATTLEAALSIVVATLFGATLLAIAQRDAIGFVPAIGAAVAAIAAGAILLQPRLFGAVLGRMLRLVGRQPLDSDEFPGTRSMALAAILVLGNQAVNGIAVLMLLHAVAGAAWTDFPMATAALSLAGAAAMLVVLAPAGLGVRDGAMTTLLSSRFTFEAAALVTVLVRAITAVSDIMLALGALVYDVVAGKRVLARALGREETPVRAVPSPQLAEERAA